MLLALNNLLSFAPPARASAMTAAASNRPLHGRRREESCGATLMYDDDSNPAAKKKSGCNFERMMASVENAAIYNSHHLGRWAEKANKVGRSTSKTAHAECLGCGATVDVYQYATLVPIHPGWEQDPREPIGKARTNVVGEDIVNAICPVPDFANHGVK